MHTKTIFILIAIVSAIVLGIIWDKSNVEEGLCKIQAYTDPLFGSAKKRVFLRGVAPSIHRNFRQIIRPPLSKKTTP